MPRLGDGTYQRTDGTRTGATVFALQDGASVNPSAELFDNVSEDMARAITASLASDGQTSPSADLPMAGHKHTGVEDAAANDQYASLGQLRSLAGIFVPSTGVGGSANAIALTPSPAITAYETGLLVNFFAMFDSFNDVTIRISGLLATPLLIGGVHQMPTDNIAVGNLISVMYDGTQFRPTGTPVWYGTATEYAALTTSDRVTYNVYE